MYIGKFLAYVDVVSYPLIIHDNLHDVDLSFYEDYNRGVLNSLDNDVIGLNGDVLTVANVSKYLGLKSHWLLLRNYIWVFERKPWLSNEGLVSTLHYGSAADAMLRLFKHITGFNFEIINYNEPNNVIEDLERGEVDAIVLPMGFPLLRRRVNTHHLFWVKSYPLDRLFLQYLGYTPPGFYAMAVRDGFAKLIEELYVRGIAMLRAKDGVMKLKIRLKDLFRIDAQPEILHQIIANTRFEPLNGTCMKALMGKLKNIYGEGIII